MASLLYTPKNILITGAAGFIASHVANLLARNYPHYKIVVLDKLDYCSNLKNLHPSMGLKNFRFVEGDICCADLVADLLNSEAIDTIMHFAAQTHVDNSFGNSLEFTMNNVYGTHILLEACKFTRRIRRFIHVSTDEVYGETEADATVGNHEASQLLPTNPYSATKAGAEMLVLAYGHSYGLPFITTRGNNVYGPNQFPEKLVPKLILLAKEGKPLPIYGDGSNVRSFLYCEDVAEAFELILHKGEVGDVYNIGTTWERQVLDVAKDVCNLFKQDPKDLIQFVENRPFNDRRYFLDDKKLRGLGWEPHTTWEEGLLKTAEWYVQNPDWWGDVSGALVAHPHKNVNGCLEGQSACALNNGVLHATDEARFKSAHARPLSKLLVYGGDCWIGSLLAEICKEKNIEFKHGSGMLENRMSLEADLESVKPTHVVNITAGLTACPNGDQYVSHQAETLCVNVVGTLTLADVCLQHGLFLLNFATGCATVFQEEDIHSFTGSFYSKTKAMVEEILKNYKNVCTLRMGLLVSSDLTNPRNIITNIIRCAKVGKITNSMTVLDEMIPIAIEMAKRNLIGTWDFTNPGEVSHNEIFEMYKDYIDPSFKWENFTTEELAKVSHSNDELDALKLKREFPNVLPIKESLRKHIFEVNKGKVVNTTTFIN